MDKIITTCFKYLIKVIAPDIEGGGL